MLGTALVTLTCFPLTRQLGAAETPALRGVYNALGGTMKIGRAHV